MSENVGTIEYTVKADIWPARKSRGDCQNDSRWTHTAARCRQPAGEQASPSNEEAYSIYPSAFRRSVYRAAGAGEPAGGHRICSPPEAGRRADVEKTTTDSPDTSHLPNRHKFSVCRHRGVGLRDRNVAAAPEWDGGLSEDVIWMLRKTGWVVELAEDMAAMK